MYTAASSYSQLSSPTIVVREGNESAGQALAKPTHFVCEWTDAGTGGDRDGSLWWPVAPSGYTCLSDVAIFTSNSGNYPGRWRGADEIDGAFRCVHNSLVKRADLGEMVWSDRGSGGDTDGAVWSIHHSDGMRVGAGSGDRPPQQQSILKAFTGGLFRGMDLILSISNPGDSNLPPSQYEMKQGLTVSRSAESSWTLEIGQEIAVEASIGVAGIASGSMSHTITQKFGTTTTFNRSETSRTEETVRVNFHVPARTKVEVWQLIVKDSKETEGTFKIKSTRYVIQNVAI